MAGREILNNVIFKGDSANAERAYDRIIQKEVALWKTRNVYQNDKGQFQSVKTLDRMRIQSDEKWLENHKKVQAQMESVGNLWGVKSKVSEMERVRAINDYKIKVFMDGVKKQEAVQKTSDKAIANGKTALTAKATSMRDRLVRKPQQDPWDVWAKGIRKRESRERFMQSQGLMPGPKRDPLNIHQGIMKMKGPGGMALRMGASSGPLLLLLGAILVALKIVTKVFENKFSGLKNVMAGIRDVVELYISPISNMLIPIFLPLLRWMIQHYPSWNAWLQDIARETGKVFDQVKEMTGSGWMGTLAGMLVAGLYVIGRVVYEAMILGFQNSLWGYKILDALDNIQKWWDMNGQRILLYVVALRDWWYDNGPAIVGSLTQIARILMSIYKAIDKPSSIPGSSADWLQGKYDSFGGRDSSKEMRAYEPTVNESDAPMEYTEWDQRSTPSEYWASQPEHHGDFVVTPGGTIRTDPRDYIIGMRDPDSGAGSGDRIFNINIHAPVIDDSVVRELVEKIKELESSWE